MLPFFKAITGDQRYDELHLQYIAYYGGYCWALDDKIGSTTAKDLRQIITGTVTGGVTFQSPGYPLANQPSKCAAFATNGHISLTGVPSPSSTYSISVWVNCTTPSSGTEQVILGSTVSASSIAVLSIKNGNVLACFSAGTKRNKSGPITTGWHHICYSCLLYTSPSPRD